MVKRHNRKMKPNVFAMKDWHLEHIEKVAVTFAKGISPDASSFEKRNYKKYCNVSFCTKQIEYDMKHGVERNEAMEVFRKIRLDEKYADLQTSTEAIDRLRQLEDMLSGSQKIAPNEDRFLWHKNAYQG